MNDDSLNNRLSENLKKQANLLDELKTALPQQKTEIQAKLAVLHEEQMEILKILASVDFSSIHQTVAKATGEISWAAQDQDKGLNRWLSEITKLVSSKRDVFKEAPIIWVEGNYILARCASAFAALDVYQVSVKVLNHTCCGIKIYVKEQQFLECFFARPSSSQQKYFPLSGLPTRKFSLGDRVQTSFPDGVFDIDYTFKGTVFGCEYHHPIWAEKSSWVLRCSGWVYLVIWTWKSTSDLSTSKSCLEPDYCKEDELSLIEDLEEAPELGLTPETVQRLFGTNPQLSELLQYCSITLARDDSGGLQVNIGCPSQDIVDLLKKMRGSLEAALKALDLAEEKTKISIHH